MLMMRSGQIVNRPQTNVFRFVGERAKKDKVCRYDPKDIYEFQEELGRGGFGVVYKAQDHLTGSHVAIKVI
jgi:serine/threonine protein kinase